MKIQTLIVLVVATAAIGGAALFMAKKNRAEVKSEVAAGRLLSDLDAAKVNSIAMLTVKKADKEYTLKRAADGTWEAADKGGYPVKPEKVTGLVLGLSELRTIEPKTSKVENYSKIGVEDPGTAKPEKPATPDTPAATSNAALVTLKDDKGGTVASVIIGNTKYDGNKQGVYIRKAGEAQSWLAEGKVDLPYDFTGWVEPQIVNIPRDRVKSGTITHPDGEVTRVSREKKEDQNFTVANVPQGEELMNANAGDAIAAALGYVSLSDVKPADQIDFAGTKPDSGGKPGPRSEFLTFDGMKILVQTWDTDTPAATEGAPKESKTWAHFVAEYVEPPPPALKGPEAVPTPDEPKPGDKKPEEVQKEVTDFNAKCAKWAFEIPPYKASGFKTTVKKMLKDKPPAPPPGLNEGNAAAPMNPLAPPGSPLPTPIPTPTSTPPPAAPTGATPPSPAPAPSGEPGSPVAPPKDPPPAGPTGSTGG